MPESQTRSATDADCLGRLGPNGEAAVKDLARALKDPEASVRNHAAEALGRIGTAARDALPALKAALKDENAEVRAVAADAIKQIERPKSKE